MTCPLSRLLASIQAAARRDASRAMLLAVVLGLVRPLIVLAGPLPDPTIIDAATPYSVSYLPANVFDDNPATAYASADLGTDTFLDFDFGVAVTIAGFQMQQRNDPALVLASSLVFDDSSDFSSPIQVVNLTHTEGAWATDTFGFAPVVARYVRWDVTGTNSAVLEANGAAEITFLDLLDCGNGFLDPGEQCDDGAPNGTTASCCASYCQYQPTDTPCSGGPGMDECTPPLCDGSGTCVQSDQDGDGVSDLCDNCPADANPDQLNSDCDDPDFFGTGACDLPNPVKPGCCAGDVCDECPAQADDTNCDSSGTAQGAMGAAGGSMQSEDESVEVVIPPGALSEMTSIAVTENGPAVVPQFANAAAASFIATPHGQQFAVPATFTLTWKDRDNDGYVDGGACVLGADDGQSCDADSDCASGECTVHHSSLAEADLVLARDAAFFAAGGFEAGPYECFAHLSGACATAAADCTDAPGTGQASVAGCCDPLNNSWTFQTCSFSSFDVTMFSGVMIPGAGSPKSDCVAEWKPTDRTWGVNELQKTETVKNLLLPAVTCRDGDPCDEDGSATNEFCEFRVSICMVVNEKRLEKQINGSLQPACPPTAFQPIDEELRVVSWTLKKPRPDATDPQMQANALNLRSRMVQLGVKLGGPGAAVIGGKHSEKVLFDPDVTLLNTVNGEPACTDPVPLVVAAGDSLAIKTQAVTSVPVGENKGLKDTDKLTLTCQPAP